MAMATALAGTSRGVAPTLQKNCRVWSQDLQRLRITTTKTALKNLSISASVSRPDTSAISSGVSQGASAIAGALFAAIACSDSAMASQQVLALAANDDSRAVAMLIPLVPAVGWVLYNILQPGLNQLNKMRNVKGLVGGLGMGALGSLAFSSRAEAAAQEIAQIADSDNRGLLTLAVLLPAVGWVLYNILQPARNQLNKMRGLKGLAGAVGLGGTTSLLLADQANAAQEIVQIADSDVRGLALLGILLPAVGWVLYNILQPALNQLNKMRGVKGFTGAVGLSAATGILMSAPDAEAAQEITQLAADSRPAILLVVLIPAIGWVLFNILSPALNQLNKMRGGK